MITLRIKPPSGQTKYATNPTQEDLIKIGFSKRNVEALYDHKINKTTYTAPDGTKYTAQDVG
jgi:hypothetical protein